MIVVDGTNQPLGRLASFVARKLLEGETVYIVNASKVVISGNREFVYERWKRRVDLRTLSNPLRNTPKYPRTVEGIVRRAVRGMLPWRKKRGRDAYRRLRVFRGFPEDLKGVDVVNPGFKLPKKYVTVEELSRMLGGR